MSWALRWQTWIWACRGGAGFSLPLRIFCLPLYLAPRVKVGLRLGAGVRSSVKVRVWVGVRIKIRVKVRVGMSRACEG